MDLFIATTNMHKVSEISSILAEFKISLLHKHMEIIEPDFDSLEKIAKEKAKQAFVQLKKPVIAEDTGIFFEAYNNFPGVLAKRVFLGIGFDGLLLLIKHAKTKKAFFKTVICYEDGQVSKCFSGELKGELLEKLISKDKERLPYEKLFIPQGEKRALVDIPLDHKNKISHRAIAARKFAEWFSSRKKMAFTELV